ncbi:DUF4367 domain-containing protein [Halobaculum sp. MBLA0143]|uniref:DUF4367 domain-containing protein n=1 Tax=Halobaculum sp. MBLA0143 TaxID=3079933 RepID=UPI0035240884
MGQSRLVVATLAVTLLVVTAGCAAVGGGDPDPERIAQQVQERQGDIDVVRGVRVTTVESDGNANTTVREYVKRPPNQSRSRVVETDGGYAGAGDLIVRNEGEFVSYDASENAYSVVESDTPNGGQVVTAETINRTLSKGDVSFAGTDTVAGRSVYVVELTRETEYGTSNTTLKVDQEHWYPLAYETTTVYELDNETVTTTISMTHRNVSFDAEVAADAFEFDPPADATLERRTTFTTEEFDSVAALEEAAPFELSEPALPDDYRLDTARLVVTNGNATASTVYTDGDDGSIRLSVTEATESRLDGETVEIDGTTATVRTFGNQTSLVWRCDDTRYSLSGTLDRDALVDAAGPLVCAASDG